MYMLDDDNDKSLKSITILLKKNEAEQLLGYLTNLINSKDNDAHFHLNNEDYQKEITISLYDLNDINNFHPRIQRLIKNEE